MANKLDKMKRHQDYREFMAIKDEEEALLFWTARVATPIGKPYFTPMDYRWYTMPLRIDLRESHARRWNSLWGWLHASDRQKSDEQFEAVKALVGLVGRNTDYLGDWVESRYDNLGHSYLFPSMFSYAEWESPEDWKKGTNLSGIEENEEKRDYEVLYYWQEVKPAGEPADDGRRHCILVDRATHQEAPLLPGQEPFPR